MTQHTVTVQIDVECATPAQHLQVSNLLKTVLASLKYAVEGKHPGNSMIYKLRGDHPDSEQKIPSSEEIKQAFDNK